jgi:hypothetical protein
LLQEIPIQDNRSFIFMKARFSGFLMLLLASGWFFSCKSAPKPAVEPPPEPEQRAEETVEVIETEDADALAEAEKRRQDYEELNDTLTQARAKRQEIMNNKLYETVEERFADADDALTRATGAYEAGLEAFDEAALDDGRTALSEFSAIIDGWWLAKAESAREVSYNMQQEALKVKADVAAKESYNLAAELHNKADAALRGNDYRGAIEFYEKAAPTFSEAMEIAAEKKAKAELALQQAESKITESEKIVEDAATLLENSSDNAGENYDL